jgi:hypothetical protein
MSISQVKICVTICLLLISKSIVAATLLELNENPEYTISELNLWHSVSLMDDAISFDTIKNAYTQTSAIDHPTVTTTGTYVAKISLLNKSEVNKTWFVMPTATFIDKGLAFIEKADGTVIPLNEFSQLRDAQTPVYMHGQAFQLEIQNNEELSLWILVKAKIYAYPLSIKILSEQPFSQHQLSNNAITMITIAIMLTLSLIAFMSYFSIQKIITLACSAYIGLHAVGWVVAAGLLNDIFKHSTYNFTYGGIYLYPFAIAAASQYTRLLFDCDQQHPSLAKWLNRLSLTCLVIGGVLPWVSFPIAFFTSHVIASIWIILCVSIGISMAPLSSRRALYYLMGNTCYALSMGIYVLSHVNIMQSIPLPELWVVVALAFDCFCILLSLFSWLYHHPQHNPAYRPFSH